MPTLHTKRSSYHPEGKRKPQNRALGFGVRGYAAVLLVPMPYHQREHRHCRVAVTPVAVRGK